MEIFFRRKKWFFFLFQCMNFEFSSVHRFLDRKVVALLNRLKKTDVLSDKSTTFYGGGQSDTINSTKRINVKVLKVFCLARK